MIMRAAKTSPAKRKEKGMKHTAQMAYYTKDHRYYPIECGVIMFNSNARTERGLMRAADRAVCNYVKSRYPHATGYRVSNVI